MRVFGTLPWFLAWVLAADATAAPPVDERERATVVSAIADTLTAIYIDDAVARRAAAGLEAALRRGDFDALGEPAAFAERLTLELRQSTRDAHVEVRFRSVATDTAVPPLADWREQLRRRGNDFQRIQWLDGGVAYLDLLSFPPLDPARPTAEAAMQMLSGADAVIIDLRQNEGGTGEMVELLAAYFLPRTLLATTFKRSRNETRESWTRDDVPATRLRELPLYLLTSATTFSAAEAFAYELQARRRAVVVGAVTRGGANPGGYEPAGDRFEVFVPDVLVRSAATGGNWEGVGVRPDLLVAADQARTAAHRAALQRLLDQTRDPARREELKRSLDSHPPEKGPE